MSRLNNLRHGWFGQVLFWGYLVAVLVVAAAAGKALHDVGQVAHTAARAICQVRHSAENRVDASKQFLVDHPNGIPQAGLTKLLIQRGIYRDQQTVKALSDVKCPPATPLGG